MPDETVSLFDNPELTSKEVAKTEPGVVAEILGCQADWCQISASGTEGYIEKKELWGVYPDELIEQ